MIKAVLFDFGGVLTENGKSGFVAETVARLYNMRPKDVAIGDLHAALRRGRADDSYFLDELNRRYHGSITKEQFIAAAQAVTTPSREVYKLAARLQVQGIRTAIFSNVFSMNARELERQGYYDGFDPVILSCDEGYAKPDLPFYEVAIQKLAVDPKEILLIDDQEKCLAPARELGMQVLLAVSPDQIVRDATALIREVNEAEL